MFRRPSSHSKNVLLREQGRQRCCRGRQCGHRLARRAQRDEEGLQIIIDDVGFAVQKIFVQSAEISMNAGILPVPAFGNERGIADDIDAGIEHVGQVLTETA